MNVILVTHFSGYARLMVQRISEETITSERFLESDCSSFLSAVLVLAPGVHECHGTAYDW